MAMYSAMKRLLLGRPLLTEEEEGQRLSKPIGLAIFSSDAISSTAYATEEILRVLVPVAGLAAFSFLVPISLVVCALLAIVIASYWQTVHAYPSGGGAYVVARENLGETPAQVAGASLMVDYVLTVAVSVSAGVAAIGSAIPFVQTHKVSVGVVLILLIAMVNLRGVKESGRFFAVPTYCYILIIGGLIAYGLFREFTGDLQPLVAEAENPDLLLTGVTALLLARAFSSGAVALTGVEAISNGVTAFRRPESRNAAVTLVWMGVVLGAYFLGLSVLGSFLRPIPSEVETVLSQMGRAVFGGTNPLYFLLQAFTAMILVLAANTAYNGFPRLAAHISADRFLPRQLANRGDRLVYSNGVVFLSLTAALIYAAFGGITTALIPLYAVGVFTSFTLSQAGMVVHQWRHREGRWKLHLAISAAGATATFLVLLTVIISKFTIGAWIPAIVIPVIVMLFKGIHQHYERIRRQLRVLPGKRPQKLSTSFVVLAASVHRGVVLASRYAMSLKPDRIVALSITQDPEGRERVQREWRQHHMTIPLEVIDSPTRDLTGSVLDFLDQLDARYDHEYVTVVIPEFVVRHFWEHALHNQSALALKLALLSRKNTAVVSVPYHLSDSDEAEEIDQRGVAHRLRARVKATVGSSR